MKRRLTNYLLAVREMLPEAISSKLRAKRFRYRLKDVTPVPRSDGERPSLYIAPANFAGQGFQWTRAVKNTLGIGAANLTIPRGKTRFSSDFMVSHTVAVASTRWQRQHFDNVASGFSHVLIEACTPLFGSLFGGDVKREVAALQERGVTVGMISHGSEVRRPSGHLARHPFSMFEAMPPERVASMERVAVKNQQLIKELGLPWFVSTAGLLVDHPQASWLPVCIEVERWTTSRVVLSADIPVVVHAPSREAVKRSDLIDGALADLDARGVIHYRRIAGIPNSEMPGFLADADVLVDSVGSGNYGVAACEGMAAGLVVVATIDPAIRSLVRRETGFELPIVDTPPDAVAETIVNVVRDRDKSRAVAAAGFEFVTALHDGRRSAEALREFLDS